MRRLFIYLIITVLSANCVGQDKTITLDLQQIEFKDKALINTLSDLSKQKPDCFNENDYYILDFFYSSLSNEEYYLSINQFVADNNTPITIAYYVIVDGIVYFISNKVSTDVIKVLPSKKRYSFKNGYGINVGGDYYFLIWRTRMGYYHVLLSTCCE